jgi:hypothetical protein
MSGLLHVNWCPDCKGWKRSRLVKREIVSESARMNPLVPVVIADQEKAHHCMACGGSIVAAKLDKFQPIHYRVGLPSELSIKNELVSMDVSHVLAGA